MRDALPEFVIPRRAGQQLLSLAGTIAAEGAQRIAEAYALCAPISVSLRFAAVSENRIHASGALRTRIRLQCQRCLEHFEQPLEADVDVEFGPDEAVPDDQEHAREILPGIDQKLVLVDFIEDELLLSAPMVALHADDACHPLGNAPLEKEAVASTKRRPFGDLRSLLAGGEND